MNFSKVLEVNGYLDAIDSGEIFCVQIKDILSINSNVIITQPNSRVVVLIWFR